jgi:hypothetical protein
VFAADAVGYGESTKSLAFIGSAKSLAFIGSADATKRNCAAILTALSITRLEGSCWCLRRTRWAMEKVRECGLKSSREESRQERKAAAKTNCV